MKKVLLCAFVLGVLIPAGAQKKPVEEITKLITKNETEAHLTFLASDEMRGRDTGSPEIDIAANYIASYFRQLGVKPAPGAEQYFQKVEFEKVSPASVVQFKIQDQVFNLKDDVAVVSS